MRSSRGAGKKERKKKEEEQSGENHWDRSTCHSSPRVSVLGTLASATSTTAPPVDSYDSYSDNIEYY